MWIFGCGLGFILGPAAATHGAAQQPSLSHLQIMHNRNDDGDKTKKNTKNNLLMELFFTVLEANALVLLEQAVFRAKVALAERAVAHVSQRGRNAVLG